MIHVLLQFSDPSGSEYRTNEAICAMLESDADEGIKIDAARLLVEYGGNPFVDVIPFDGIGEEESALRLAAKSGCNNGVVRALVESGKSTLKGIQTSRRRDPKLQQQPETFFQPMEAKENMEMEAALKMSLLECLISGWDKILKNGSSEEDIKLHLSTAILLYSLGASLTDRDLVRLRLSMDIGLLKPEGVLEDYGTKISCRARYKHYLQQSVDATKFNVFDRSPVNGWSRRLLTQTWMQEDIRNTTGCTCPWVEEELDSSISDKGGATISNIADRVTLVLDDGGRLEVDASILERKSAKLASALRFAQMSQQETTNQNFSSPKHQEVHVALSSRVCKRLLQHIYHGSIFSGWSRNMEENCHDILELMLVGEEFLCPSLIQECQMRLMSSNPIQCFCWSCAKDARLVDFDSVECIYCIEGPPALVTSETVLDALAIAQHLDSVDLEDCSIRFVPYSISTINRMGSNVPSWANNNDDSAWKKLGGVSALRDATVTVLLKEFAAVVQSYAFKASLDLNTSLPNNNTSGREQVANLVEPQVLLLQMCLEEFKQFEPIHKSWKQALAPNESTNKEDRSLQFYR